MGLNLIHRLFKLEEFLEGVMSSAMLFSKNPQDFPVWVAPRYAA